MANADLAYFTHAQKNISFEDFLWLQDVWPAFVQGSQLATKILPLRFTLFNDFFVHGYDGQAGRSVCYSSGIPLCIDLKSKSYPKGWDEALQQASLNGANAVALLDVTIAHSHRRMGIAKHILKIQMQNARTRGFEYIFIPVRPLQSFASEPTQTQLVNDPWIQLHLQRGARSLGLSPNSMCITGSGADWTAWTGFKFSESGRYAIEGATVPVVYDRETDIGEYREPNLLVLYDLKHAK